MNYPESLYSIRSEGVFLGGLIKNPKVLVDLESFVSDKIFFHKVHKVCFSILKSLIFNGQEVNPIILTEKIKNIGISFFEELNLYDYLDSLSYTQINADGLKQLGKELLKMQVKRELWDNSNAIQAFLKESGEKSLDELIHGVDGIYNSQISLYATDDNPKDLYEGLKETILEIAKNPIEEVGLKTPFPIFNKWFGGALAGDGCSVVSGLSGNGKSCFLFNMAKGIAKLNNAKALILDTEMSIDMNMFRAASAETQVNNWYLRTGQWIRSKTLVDKVKTGLDKLDQYKGSIYHMYIPNKPIDEVLSIAKRWYYKECGRNNKNAIIIYDYLKITSDLNRERAEWQQLGDKISYLNELGHLLDIPIYTGAQQNRTAMPEGGKRRDDSSTVGGSDRINQYACFNSIFREKTVDEISEHGTKFGSHILIPIKTSRSQGIDSYDTNKNVQIIDDKGKKKFVRNFLNYSIDSYLITERGTYADVIKDQSLNKPVQLPSPKSENTHF